MLITRLFRLPMIGALFISLFLLASMPGVRANDSESISLSTPVLSVGYDRIWMVNAEVRVTLSPVLIDALNRGVPLHFVTELEISKKRWYWWNKEVVDLVKPVRLSYHPVIQQYRISVGGLHQLAFNELDDALNSAVSLKGWSIATPEQTYAFKALSEAQKAPEDYEMRLRVRLDTAKLPKPLQINALTNKDWNLSSEWIRPRFAPPVPSLSGDRP
jgi:hypothetical protein